MENSIDYDASGKLDDDDNRLKIILHNISTGELVAATHCCKTPPRRTHVSI